ncbi:MAG: response regulator [Dehalococcoidia bacterium]
MPDQIRVLIADDQAVVRQGLTLFLGLQDDMTVVGEAADGAEAVERANETNPDVVLMDLVMPRMDGIQAIRAVKERRPEARVLVLTSFADDDKLFPALRAGAAGYLLKDVAPEQLAEAIRTVHRGDPLLHPEIARRLMQRFSAAGQRPEGTVTILFTDVEDSCGVFGRLGDEAARDVFREHDRLLREVFKEHGGLEVKHQGDGFMIAFSGARRALLCAAAIQRTIAGDRCGAALRVRVGLNTGEVIAEEEDYFGEAVITASRIAGLAGGRQVFVSSLTKELAGTSPFQFIDQGEHELKGMRGTHRVFELAWDDGNVGAH